MADAQCMEWISLAVVVSSASSSSSMGNCWPRRSSAGGEAVAGQQHSRGRLHRGSSPWILSGELVVALAFICVLIGPRWPGAGGAGAQLVVLRYLFTRKVCVFVVALAFIFVLIGPRWARGRLSRSSAGGSFTTSLARSVPSCLVVS